MNDTATHTSPASNITFALPATVTIDTVEAVASGIRALLLPAGATLTLDAASTEILTTPGIQLFLSLEKTLAQSGGRLAFAHAREAVADHFRILALQDKYNSWSNSNG